MEFVLAAGLEVVLAVGWWAYIVSKAWCEPSAKPRSPGHDRLIRQELCADKGRRQLGAKRV